uniref:Uncharacterized protein n=1 Tax=Arundo donax TaxID=35708 RepID=A0A0A8YMY0_ARUDO
MQPLSPPAWQGHSVRGCLLQRPSTQDRRS